MVSDWLSTSEPHGFGSILSSCSYLRQASGMPVFSTLVSRVCEAAFRPQIQTIKNTYNKRSVCSCQLSDPTLWQAKSWQLNAPRTHTK